MSVNTQKWILVAMVVAAGLYAFKMYVLDPRAFERERREELTRGAHEYVQRFILLEREGRYETTDRYLAGCELAYRPELDEVEPRTSARVIGAELEGDEAIVRVEYVTLGRYYAGHFTADVRVDTVPFYVSLDEMGLPWIDCERVGSYRWGVDAMQPYVDDFDLRSADEWERALREASQLAAEG